MKNLGFYIACIFSFFAFNLTSQEVMESEKVMSKGLNSSVSIELSNVDNRQVDAWWRDFIREYTRRVKKDRKSKEWVASSATIADIHSRPIDLYTKIESAGKYVSVTTWVEVDSNFVSSSSHPESFAGIEKIMQDFDHHVGTEVVKIELTNEERSLKKLENELKKLQNQNNSYHKQIESFQAKIAQAEENILKNEESQETVQDNIDGQIGAVEAVRVKLTDMENIRSRKKKN